MEFIDFVKGLKLHDLSSFCVQRNTLMGGGGAGQLRRAKKVLGCPKGGGAKKVFRSKGGVKNVLPN